MEACSYEAALYLLIRIQIKVKCFASKTEYRQSSARSSGKKGQLWMKREYHKDTAAGQK
jgi:hypothetical protein